MIRTHPSKINHFYPSLAWRAKLQRRAEARPTSALPRPREGDQRPRRPQSRMASGSGVPAAQVSSRRAMGIQYQVADSPPRERRARRPAEPRTNGLTNGEESSTVMMSVWILRQAAGMERQEQVPPPVRT